LPLGLLAEIGIPMAEPDGDANEEGAEGDGGSEGAKVDLKRFGRIVLTANETKQETDGEVVREVLSTFRRLNAELLGLDPDGGEFLVRRLSQEEQDDPHLDILTGFSVLDGRTRIFVMEGLRAGVSLAKLLEVIPRGPEAPKLLHDSLVGYGERLYAAFGPHLKQVKVRRATLENLVCRPGLYIPSKSSTEADLAGNEAPKMVMHLRSLTRLRSVRESTHFPEASQVSQMELLYGDYVSDNELIGLPAEEEISVAAKKRVLSSANSRDSGAATDPSATAASQRKFLRQVVNVDDDNVNETLLPEDVAAVRSPTQRFLNRKFLKPETEQENSIHEQSVDLRRSMSMQDFKTTNRKLVRTQSEANVHMNNLLGKKRERETPFIEGQVYLYSSQKLNSAELQKEWMRKHMDNHASEQMWSYNPAYMSGNFEFSGAAPPGVQAHQPSCPSDTYARLGGDDREIFRVTQARPPEAFRRPGRDLDQATVELLHEPFEENEWHQLAVGDGRRRPVRVEHSFHTDKLPHHRKKTVRPFDSQHNLLRPGSEFGPAADFESVHYHGRRMNETRHEQYEERNVREREIAASGIRSTRELKTFSETTNRKGITDLDRNERMAKDKSYMEFRGRLDARHPETMRTMETYHDLGRPDLEWHARLRENDLSPPLEVMTGTYIKRDPLVGTGSKRAVMSGKLAKAPWQHETGTMKSLANATNRAPLSKYGSQTDFRTNAKAPSSRAVEEQLWKTASRTGIAQHERSRREYLRPHHYGVQIA